MDPSELRFELDLIRACLDTLTARRLVAPFSPEEEVDYHRMAQRESELIKLLRAAVTPV